MPDNEISSPSPPHQSASRAGAVESAIAHLRRGLRGDGTYEGVGEWDVLDHQWGLFAEWADRERLIVPPELLPAQEGGREHDVRFDGANGRWIKFTKPCSAGFAVEMIDGRLVMTPASPLQYLERWRLHNRLFFDDVFLLGLRSEGNAHRIVVSQRDYGADTPTWEGLNRAMVDDYGLARLAIHSELGGYEARAYLQGRFAVFDVRPANCARTPSGLIIPFDAIPQVFGLADAVALSEMR